MALIAITSVLLRAPYRDTAVVEGKMLCAEAEDGVLFQVGIIKGGQEMPKGPCANKGGICPRTFQESTAGQML